MCGMKGMFAVAIVGMMSMLMAGAEMRVFTNKEGKTLEAELLLVDKSKAVLKLVNGKQVGVAMDTLSEADQDFIKTWWEENKDKVKPTDLTLVLERKKSKARRKKSRSYNEEMGIDDRSSSYSYDLKYVGEFKNIAGKDLRNITVKYTMYKGTFEGFIVAGREEPHEKIEGTCEIALLRTQGTESFETVEVNCASSSHSIGGDHMGGSATFVKGITVTLSVGGMEFLTVHDPVNLPELIKQKDKK